LAAQAHRLNGTKVNIELPHAGQLSPVPVETHDFFEQEFTNKTNISDSKLVESARNYDTTSDDAGNLGGGVQEEAPIVLKPVKKIAVSYLNSIYTQ
jgi:hypothetical protein